MRGRSIKLTPSSRVRNDMLYFANRAPLLPVHRRMALGALIEARASCPHRPPWTALFVKGFAILAQKVPELRRVYIGFPVPHLYEYPQSVGLISVERQTDEGPAVFVGKVKEPANLPLSELVKLVRRFNEAPLADIKEFRRVLVLGRLPGPVRRLLMWVGLNIGRQRANFFGTFALSVYSALGVESLRPLFPTTVVLNYGPFAADGTVDVRFVYDHRVTDGAVIARALRLFETILTEKMVAEVNAWR
jgi:hypothetical protein